MFTALRWASLGRWLACGQALDLAIHREQNEGWAGRRGFEKGD